MCTTTKRLLVLQAWASDNALPIVAVDTLPDAVPVEQRALPEACVLLFGQEGPGLSPEAVAAADSAVVIQAVRIDEVAQRSRRGRDRDARMGAGARAALKFATAEHLKAAA